MNIMSIVTVALLLSLTTSAFAATNNGFCVASNGNQTYDLNPIAAALYNATMAADNGVNPIIVNFGWCGTINSTACNVTNWGLTIETPAPTSCVTGFEVFIGPATVSNGAVTFQMWGGTDGVIAYVTVNCNNAGQHGVATLEGIVVNEPIYNYYLTFSSVHGCPVS